jgi:hypothetical protein
LKPPLSTSLIYFPFFKSYGSPGRNASGSL